MRRNRRDAILLVGIATSLFGVGEALAQSTIHVDADATGPMHDGSSWCQAFTELGDALAVAVSGDEVLVADGQYIPDPTGLMNSRDATFTLVDGVTIQGGFAGCGAANPDARDTRLFETILTGDLAGNDTPNFGNLSDNVLHVVTGISVEAATMLDGFTIASGYADGVCCDVPSNGGGVYLDNANPVISHCRFRSNSASRGGALYNQGGAPLIEHCVFENNRADSDQLASGGAVYTSNGNAQLRNCLFVGNHSGLTSQNPLAVGGAVTSFEGMTTVQNCTFTENSAMANGGGIFLAGTSAVLTVTDSIFWDNKDTPAMVADESAQLVALSGTITVDYSDIQGLTGALLGTGNIGLDPLFAPGPAGCYYLRQTAVDPGTQSPCVDAGSGTAASLWMGSSTTRSDESLDASTVDMGFHYPITGLGFILGDANRTGSVELADFAAFQQCYTDVGPAGVAPCCRVFDMDGDDDIDLDDYKLFEPVLLGP